MSFDITLSGNATFSANGKFGKSFASGYGLIVGGSSNILSGASSFTLEVWVKSSSNSQQTIMGTAGMVWMGIDPNGKATATMNNANTYVDDLFTSINPITDGQWHHIALCVAPGANNTRFFVDGVLQGEKTNGMSLTTYRHKDFGIRTLPEYGTGLNGEIDDLCIYSFAKYTAAFAVPTTAQSNSQNNMLGSYHFEGDGVNKVGTDPTPPVFTAPPVVNGTPRVGDVTTYTPGTITTNEVPTTTQQWVISDTVNGATTDIAGATGTTYTPVAANAGKYIGVRQKAINSASPGGVTSASALTLVAAAAGQYTRSVSAICMISDEEIASSMAGMSVSLSTGTGPHNPGTVLYSSATESTDVSGKLEFSFDTQLIAAGAQALLSVIGPNGVNVVSMVGVA